ncbi:MAG: energy-coupling factor ABC transporter permease [Verrucomicrobia bacterium]|jgi:cobalt/nickel transport system permease protein|nr:energy-coupling factor ABC transporter permease [Verrucomicrobiota bacterium]
MHIPDGFIDARTAAVTASLSVAGVGLALRQAKRKLPPRRVPLLGLSAAFVFAAQMLNFPVVGGTSGHLMGSALVVALLGPASAVVVMTTVLIVQCFLFADGGVTALGANVFNMALLGSAGACLPYALLTRWLPGVRGRITAVAFAGWFSVVLASVGCAGQLAWSGTVSWSAAFTTMVSIHMLIGVGEGLISALVLLAIERTRPELVTGQTVGEPADWKQWGAWALFVAMGLALFVAPFACPWPDGLESVAGKLGFEHYAVGNALPAPLSDYEMPGIHWAVGATAVAGVVGTVVVLVLSWVLGRILVPAAGAVAAGGNGEVNDV